MFKIREVEIPNRVVLAPMAGVCNAAFRLTAKEFGAGLVCAEMVSDKAILFNNKKNDEYAIYRSKRASAKFTNLRWRD